MKKPSVRVSCTIYRHETSCESHVLMRGMESPGSFHLYLLLILNKLLNGWLDSRGLGLVQEHRIGCIEKNKNTTLTNQSRVISDKIISLKLVLNFFRTKMPLCMHPPSSAAATRPSSGFHTDGPGWWVIALSAPRLTHPPW